MANLAIVNNSAYAAQVSMGSSYQAVIVTAASCLAFTNAATFPGLRRGKIYDILVGTNATPADTYVEYAIARGTCGCTAAVTGAVSSISSNLGVDVGDNGGAASFLVANASAGSSTLYAQTTQLWYVGVNQRASYRWVAAPGSEFVYPAVSSVTGNNGLQLMARGSYTSTVTATVLLSEQ